MYVYFFHTFHRSEIDSELNHDRSQVLGVLAADREGLCLLSQGAIDPGLSSIASSLTKLSKGLEPGLVPTIILDSDSK